MMDINFFYKQEGSRGGGGVAVLGEEMFFLQSNDIIWSM